MLKKVYIVLFAYCLAFFQVYATLNLLEFVIVIPSYNDEKICVKNLESAVKQTKDGIDYAYRILYINDCSTDKTLELVTNYVQQNNLQNLVTIKNNQERLGSLENIFNAAHEIAGHKIVVLLDGDDWLASNALARLANEYSNQDTWLTYGQYQYQPGGYLGVCKELPNFIVHHQLFRQYSWVTSHLKTFKASLFKKIKKEDLIDKTTNKFYQMAGDIAFMYPMLEMASNNHIKFIPDIIYYYNYTNPISDHNINQDLQLRINLEIIAKPKYQVLNNLD